MEEELPGRAGRGWRQGFPTDKASPGAQFACSKALLQRDTFRIQLLGKQMHGLQRVPTALGIHKCATSWDFDWQ